MDTATYLELLQQYPVESDPRLLEQRTAVMNHYLQDPLLRERVLKPVREEAAHEDARQSLRVVLAARGLAPTPEQEAHIDAQDDIGTLHRWLAQTATATSADQALA